MRRSRTRLCIAMSCVLSAVWTPMPASAASGDLDPSFGSGGIVTTDFGGGNDLLRAMAVQSDGKMVLAGRNNDRFAIARLNADGTVDTSFGQGGSIAIDAGTGLAPGETQFANAVAIQPDGRIVVVGKADESFVAVRFLPDGAIDVTFGDSGFVRVALEFGFASAVVVQPDGSIVMAGPAGDDLTLVRVLFDGSLDPSFGDEGIVETPVHGSGVIEAMAQAGDDFVVAGFVQVRNSRTFAVARYGQDGSPDPSFGQGGVVTTPVCKNWSQAHAVAVDPAGRLVVAGSCGSYVEDRVAVARYDPDGTLDTEFGKQGVVLTDTEPGLADIAHSVAVDGTGRILIAGLAEAYPISNWLVARYRDDGTPGRTFGHRGLVLLPMGTYEGAWGVALVANGEIAVGGTSSRGGFDLAVARLSDRGVLQEAFGVGGVGLVGMAGGPDGAAAIVQQPNGMFVAAGSASGAFALARYTREGAPDSSFGTGGKVVTPLLGGAYGEASALAVDPDGQLVVAGGTDSFRVGVRERGFQVARYLPNGTIDTSFGGVGIVRTAVDDLISATAVAVLPDGRIVAGGVARAGFGLARYLADGELDLSFGEDGVVTTAFGPSAQLLGLVLQPDGRVVGAGWSSRGFVLARYEVDGSLDPMFGDAGRVRTTFAPGFSGASALTIQPDGRLIAAGQAGGQHCEIGIARYDTSGNLDPTFGNGGMVTTSLGAGCERASEVRVQPDGRIVAVGGSGRNSVGMAVIRYLSDGSLDEAFGNAGIVTTNVSTSFDWAYGVVIQPDGGIVTAGVGDYPSDFVIMRFLP